MAQPVQYTVEDLKSKLAELVMEVTLRARREDALVKEIAQLKAELEALKKAE